jgi:hypothetical protein
MRDSRLRHCEKEFQLLNYSLVYTLLQQNTKLLHKERERDTHTDNHSHIERQRDRGRGWYYWITVVVEFNFSSAFSVVV